jgi:hypothetical protein
MQVIRRTGMIDYMQVIPSPSTLIPDQNCYRVALLVRDMIVERDLSNPSVAADDDKSCLAAENQIAQAREIQ